MAARSARGATYQRHAAALRAQRLPCAICGRAIDYGAKPRSSPSFSADHIIPVNKGGNPDDPANLRPAHFGCNAARHDDDHTISRPSRVW